MSEQLEICAYLRDLGHRIHLAIHQYRGVEDDQGRLVLGDDDGMRLIDVEREVTRLREENEKWQAMAQTAGFPVDGLLAVGSELTRLRAMLGKATVRLGIVRDRMEACEADRPATHDHSHALSLFEIPAWIEEQSSLLSSPHEEIGKP